MFKEAIVYYKKLLLQMGSQQIRQQIWTFVRLDYSEMISEPRRLEL